MLTVPFLTEIDSRAAIRGSRDPLGVQPIWSRLGRHVVGNLTTVSTSLRDFTTLLLGYHFCERVTDTGGGSELSTFLKWEQLCAYARVAVNGEREGLRGIERVQRNLNAGKRVQISDDPSCQILGNQKIYGLWGLYTVPARSSGLVEGAPTRLTAAAHTLVDSVYLPVLSRAGFKNGDAIVRLLHERRTEIDVQGKHRPLLLAIARILDKRVLDAERELYRDHLLHGGPCDRTNGLQIQLLHLLEETLDEDWVPSPPRIAELTGFARERGGSDERLAGRLERIRKVEQLIAPAENLFGHLLASEGQTADEAARAVRSVWGKSMPHIDPDSLDAIRDDLRATDGSPESAERWIRIARSMREGDFESATGLLFAQNRAVMKARTGSDAWAEIRDGRIHVRFKDQSTPPLPKRRELPHFWLNPYFIPSLRNMARALRS